MKFKIYWIVALATMILLLCACSLNNEDKVSSDKYPEIFESSSTKEDKVENMLGDATIVINGNETQIKAVTYESTDHLPLLSLIEAFGGKVVWNDDSFASIVYNGEELVLDLLSKSIVRKTEDYNNLIPNGKYSTYKCDVEGKQIIVDSKTFCLFMGNLKAPVNYMTDYESMKIFIDIKE